MRHSTAELKRFIRATADDQKPPARMARDNFEIALSLAIRHREAQDRTDGLLFDSALVAGWKAILLASQNHQHITIED